MLEAESPGIADKMRELQKAGKVVIAIDSDGQTDARRAYIGTNQPQGGRSGRQGGQDAAAAGGKVVAFVGTAAAANASERREGFFAGAGDRSGSTPEQDALEVFEDGTDTSQAQSNVQTAISKYPDAGVFLGLWSYNAHFIAEEVGKFPELRKKTTIVTFDLDELAVEDVADGRSTPPSARTPTRWATSASGCSRPSSRRTRRPSTRCSPAAPTHRHRRPRDRRPQQGLAGEGRQRDRHRRDEDVAGEQGAEVDLTGLVLLIVIGSAIDLGRRSGHAADADSRKRLTAGLHLTRQ